MTKKIKKTKFTCWDGKTTELYPIEIRSVDAWRNEYGGWDYNNSFVICREECKDLLLSPEITTRKLLGFLREIDVLTKESKGMLRVEDSWPYVEIQNKNTFEPLIQIYFDEEGKRELYV